MTVNFEDIQRAQQRVAPFVHTTPIVSSKLLNKLLGHEIYFKAECLQKTGAFKIRGATNFVSKLAETPNKVTKIVANSSGNHAQAVAYAGTVHGFEVDIFAASNISPIKAAATKAYGANLHLFDSRVEADNAVERAAEPETSVWIPPYNHKDIIAGQGTVAAEALQQTENIDAIFAPCGGGGLVSGSLIAARHLSPNTDVIGVEPLSANDAARSLREGKILSLEGPANTLADGAATPHVGKLTFPFLQKLDDFYEVDELAIRYWTQWLHHLLKLHIEPTCAMTMEAVAQYLKSKQTQQRILVIISGGNISSSAMLKIFEKDYLYQLPTTGKLCLK